MSATDQKDSRYALESPPKTLTHAGAATAEAAETRAFRVPSHTGAPAIDAAFCPASQQQSCSNAIVGSEDVPELTSGVQDHGHGGNQEQLLREVLNSRLHVLVILDPNFEL